MNDTDDSDDSKAIAAMYNNNVKCREILTASSRLKKKGNGKINIFRYVVAMLNHNVESLHSEHVAT